MRRTDLHRSAGGADKAGADRFTFAFAQGAVRNASLRVSLIVQADPPLLGAFALACRDGRRKLLGFGPSVTETGGPMPNTFCLASFVIVCFLAFARGADPDPATPPPPQAGDAAALIKQLGDADFKAREAASERLKSMGAAALPGLKEAITSSDDPEICSRADSLVRQIERPRVPADWLGPDGFGGRGFGGTQITTSVIRGNRVVRVEDGTGRRKIVIREGPQGIEMTVTGAKNGQDVTAQFRAASAAELAEQDPEAYRVYQRWARNGPAPFMRGRRLIAPPAAIRREFRVAAAPPELIFRPPADDIEALEARILRQLREANVADEQQRAVRDLLKQLRRIQAEGPAAAQPQWNQQIQRYNGLSDALREKLAELKLPDPGESLPPPAKARLGISVGAGPLIVPGGVEEGLTVSRVVPDSRGERIGIKDGDVIRTVNGKAVPDTQALRRAVTEATDPLVIEVVRGGKPHTLREKPGGK